jgi:superfamily I DNA/RNA helicase
MLKRAIAAGTPLERIAYISHTKAASDEARVRAAALLNIVPGSRKLKWFKTVHACCFEMMQFGRNDVMNSDDIAKFVKQSGFKLSMKNDLEAFTADDFEENDDALRHARDVAIHKKITPREALSFMGLDASGRIDHFIEKYEAFKLSIGKWDFGDMLTQYHGNPVENIDIVFVDEAQDLSRRQWDIVFKLFENAKEITVAGDDDQSIYAFMGADEYAFLDLKSDEDVVLDYSYRVPSSIGAKAERIIRRVHRRRDKAVRWQNSRGELRYFGGDIGDLPFSTFIEQGKSVMVLVPHVKQGHAVRGVLEERGITSSFKGTSITTRFEAVNVHSYFTVKRGGSIAPALGAQLLNVLGGSEKETSDIRALAKNPGARVSKVDLPQINFDHEDWTAYFGKKHQRGGLYRKLRTVLNKSGLEVIGKQPAIDISTYHGSKGREADIVILVTDCYRSFATDCQEGKPSMSRLCYVGLTRAKERAIIIEPKTNRYLLPLME